jgi:hypothetical protein
MFDARTKAGRITEIFSSLKPIYISAVCLMMTVLPNPSRDVQVEGGIVPAEAE